MRGKERGDTKEQKVSGGVFLEVRKRGSRTVTGKE